MYVARIRNKSRYWIHPPIAKLLIIRITSYSLPTCMSLCDYRRPCIWPCLSEASIVRESHLRHASSEAEALLKSRFIRWDWSLILQEGASLGGLLRISFSAEARYVSPIHQSISSASLTTRVAWLESWTQECTPIDWDNAAC